MGGQMGGQGAGRKKRKSQSKQQSGFQPSPGNSINGSNGSNGSGGMNGNGGGQGKKRGKQKGPRQFVGPMDHSYRVANGNVADGPPSTIPFQGNGHGAYYNDAPVRGAQAPAIAADAPTRIFFFIEDLFFLAKIQEASRKLGVKVEFVKGDKEVLARITDAAEGERPSLLVFDLNNPTIKPLTIIPKLKAKLKKSVSIIGFLSHLQGDLKLKATEAGCDTVMPRSAFSQSLPNLLRRYGMDEEEDYYQPSF
jgi:CheY-like chemotaxis protein